MFLKNKDNTIRIIEGDPIKLEEKLDAGVYTLSITRSFTGSIIELSPVSRYNIDFNITAGIYDEVVNCVVDFIDPVMYESRAEMGKLNKIGFMFDGDPGTGKTFLAGQIGYYLGKVKNAITIIVKGTEQSYDFAGLIDQIREFDKDRFVVVIFDEFEKDYCDTNLLSFLDGASSKDNCLIIATVNDTSKLPKWVKERRGRFEKIFTFKVSDKDVFESIVNSMLPEKYRGLVNVDEIYNICQVVGMTIDDIDIETRNALFRYKKIQADPTCAERYDVKLIIDNTTKNLALNALKAAMVENAVDIEFEDEKLEELDIYNSIEEYNE